MQQTMTLEVEEALNTLVAHNNALRLAMAPALFSGRNGEREMQRAVGIDLHQYRQMADEDVIALAQEVAKQ